MNESLALSRSLSAAPPTATVSDLVYGSSLIYILTYPVLSCPNPSHPVPSRPIPSRPVPPASTRVDLSSGSMVCTRGISQPGDKRKKDQKKIKGKKGEERKWGRLDNMGV